MRRESTVMTWPQYRDMRVRETAQDSKCTLAEARECAESWLPEWRNVAEEKIADGWLPGQRWINSALVAAPDWWKGYLKHHPDFFDKLVRLDRSVYLTKTEFEARAETLRKEDQWQRPSASH